MKSLRTELEERQDKQAVRIANEVTHTQYSQYSQYSSLHLSLHRDPTLAVWSDRRRRARAARPGEGDQRGQPRHHGYPRRATQEARKG